MGCKKNELEVVFDGLKIVLNSWKYYSGLTYLK